MKKSIVQKMTDDSQKYTYLYILNSALFLAVQEIEFFFNFLEYCENFRTSHTLSTQWGPSYSLMTTKGVLTIKSSLCLARRCPLLHRSPKIYFTNEVKKSRENEPYLIGFLQDNIDAAKQVCSIFCYSIHTATKTTFLTCSTFVWLYQSIRHK